MFCKSIDFLEVMMYPTSFHIFGLQPRYLKSSLSHYWRWLVHRDLQAERTPLLPKPFGAALKQHCEQGCSQA
jgi:hypothetical protein